MICTTNTVIEPIICEHAQSNNKYVQKDKKSTSIERISKEYSAERYSCGSICEEEDLIDFRNLTRKK